METPQFLFVIGAVWAVLITLLWLRIGWRATRAHDKLADSVDEIRHAVRNHFKSLRDL